jgi:hypothetical protein
MNHVQYILFNIKITKLFKQGIDLYAPFSYFSQCCGLKDLAYKSICVRGGGIKLLNLRAGRYVIVDAVTFLALAFI